MQSLTKAVFLYGSQVPDKTTWLDTAPSCLAPDFPVDYSSGSGFEAAAAFPWDPGTPAAGSAGQAGNLKEERRLQIPCRL